MTATVKQGKLPFKARISRGERRAKILDAAGDLFARQGYDATSLTEVAAASEITKAVIYEHFGSKTELYISLLEQKASELVALVYERMDALDESDSAEESLRTALDAFFEFSELQPAAWRLMFRDPPAEAAIADACSQLREAATAAVAERLRRHPAAQAAGLTATNPQIGLAAEFLMSGMVGVASRWYPQHQAPRAEVIESLLQLAWPGLARLAESLTPPRTRSRS
jgi:AcrR family transcriptional regulator